MKEKTITWQDRRINAMKRMMDRKGSHLHEKYLDEYHSVLHSKAKNKQQYKGEKMTEEKKDWEVTLSCMKKHEDTYLIRNVTKEDAIYIAENQNQSPRYDCTLIKESESDGEDEETSIRPLDYQKEVK